MRARYRPSTHAVDARRNATVGGARLGQTLRMDEQNHAPPSDRVTLRRGAVRAAYDPAVVRAILDAGLIAHVGVPADDGPIVLPMAYGRTEDIIYLHGSAANSMLRNARNTDICVTVTLVDGLVFARSPFHNSMNYRSVVIRGIARPVDDPAEHVTALRLITNHVVANWDNGREPTATEIRKTMVVALPLDEVSAKVRGGGPIDEPDDLDGSHWGGTVALRQTWERPVDAPDLRPGIAVPESITAAFGGAHRT
jgi:nitroimidazol reductase NimA-like FMN-containing flavoprotein (pyridoxamine 5'-phosphate oxidase superfamily)